MTDLRTSAQMALDILEGFYASKIGLFDSHDKAVEILRAALAQPEKTNQCGEVCERAKLCSVCARGLAQPEPEPVAKYSDIISDGGLDPRNKFDAAPPQREWQGLTDKEILKFDYAFGANDVLLNFARAIEAKLKEKNNG